MDASSPDTWRWIWLCAAAVLLLGEVIATGTFFLISFAVGAAVACVLAFLGVDVAWQWGAFVVVSSASVLTLRPIGRRLNAAGSPDRVGAERWEGRTATVVRRIPAGVQETGVVRIEREEWRAESVDSNAIPLHAVVRVVRVSGTRVVVTTEMSDAEETA